MKLARRIEKVLAEAEALAKRQRTPDYVVYPTEEDYASAVTRGEVPRGAKVYVGWDPGEVL